jgi:hypothetical protein
VIPSIALRHIDSRNNNCKIEFLSRGNIQLLTTCDDFSQKRTFTAMIHPKHKENPERVVERYTGLHEGLKMKGSNLHSQKRLFK